MRPRGSGANRGPGVNPLEGGEHLFGNRWPDRCGAARELELVRLLDTDPKERVPDLLPV